MVGLWYRVSSLSSEELTHSLKLSVRVGAGSVLYNSTASVQFPSNSKLAPYSLSFNLDRVDDYTSENILRTVGSDGGGDVDDDHDGYY